MRVLGISLGLTLLSVPCAAQLAPDTTILADSLGWTLRRWTQLAHNRPVSTCEISRPGARMEFPPHDSPVLEVPFEDPRELAARGLAVEAFVLQLDNRTPLARLPTPTERYWAALVLRGSWFIQQPKSDTLRIRVTYSLDGKPGAGGRQDLEIDIRGLVALVPRANNCR